jgi:drug/metabolite transporter (DMT)-like permease
VSIAASREEAGAAAPQPVAAAGIPMLPAPVVVAGLVVGVLAVSTSAVLIRVADANPLALSFWRCAGGTAALAPFALRARRAAPRLDGTQWRQLVGSGLFLAVHFALFIGSLSYTSVASSSVLVAMSPLFVAVGSAVFLAERPGPRTWLGIALAVAGAGVVGLLDADGGGGPAPLLGNLLAFGGAAAVAGYLLIGRSARRRLPITVYAAAVYGVAAVALLVACLAAGVELAGYEKTTWLAIAGLILGPQLLGHTIFNTLLSTVAATVVAVVVLAEPIGATVLAAVLLGEAPGGGFLLGGPLILAGVFLAATAGARRRGTIDAVPPA